MDRATFIQLATEKYGEEFDYSYIPGQLKKRSPVTIICRKHGKFSCSPRDHLRSKYGCPRCRCEKIKKPSHLRISQFIEKSRIKFGHKFDYSHVSDTAGPHDKVILGCPIHGKIQTSLKSHLHSDHGCFICGNERSRLGRIKYASLDALIPYLRKVHGFKYEYLNYDPERRVISFSCKHGVSEQLVRSHLTGRGCKECGYEQNSLSKESFLQRAALVHPEGYRYELSNVMRQKDKITIIHKCGNVYRGRISNHLNGQGCIRCKVSVGETKICKFLDRNKIAFVNQFKIEGHKYRYDFYIPELGMLIEYDGEQHFRSVPYFGGDEQYEKIKLNDAIKNELAKAYGYLLVRIPHTQLKNIEDYLSRAIDGYFNYRVDFVFYRTFMDLYRAKHLPSNLKVREMDAYRTYRVLSPLDQ